MDRLFSSFNSANFNILQNHHSTAFSQVQYDSFSIIIIVSKQESSLSDMKDFRVEAIGFLPLVSYQTLVARNISWVPSNTCLSYILYVSLKFSFNRP